ncbi:MAG: PP2C family protein-serine/threonine phosphatase [Candidatus Margulisiibacteriota bacterium]
MSVDLNTYLHELEMAKSVQEGILSVQHVQNCPGIQVVQRCVPAQRLAGDFYVLNTRSGKNLPQRTAIPGVIQFNESAETLVDLVIGDVAGHGISSALIMSLATVLLEENIGSCGSPKAVLAKTNADLMKYLQDSPHLFVTLFYASYGLQSKRLTYAKAGHHPVVLLRDGVLSELDVDGDMLGLYTEALFDEATVELQSKDRLLFYTDGLIETQNEAGEEFGLDRFKAVFLAHQQDPLPVVMDELLTAVTTFSGNRPGQDDQTVILVETTDA